MNTVSLVGRLTKDVDYRQTQQGTSVANFTLAVSRNYKNRDGEQEADFILCKAWRGVADVLHQWTAKGSQIGVTGSIETRSYDNEQGQRVFITEVNVRDMYLLGAKNENQQGQHKYQQQTYAQGGQDMNSQSLPF